MRPLIHSTLVMLTMLFSLQAMATAVEASEVSDPQALVENATAEMLQSLRIMRHN